MKKVFVAIALTTFVGSMASTAIAAVNGTHIVIKDNDKGKKKKKKKSCCSANGEQKSCSSSNSTQKSCSGGHH